MEGELKGNVKESREAGCCSTRNPTTEGLAVRARAWQGRSGIVQQSQRNHCKLNHLLNTTTTKHMY